jgi:predicted small secreted protein
MCKANAVVPGRKHDAFAAFEAVAEHESPAVVDYRNGFTAAMKGSIFTTNQKGNIMKKIVSVLSLLAFAFGLSACNTMKGAGQDIERGGEKIQGAAADRQAK